MIYLGNQTVASWEMLINGGLWLGKSALPRRFLIAMFDYRRDQGRINV